MKLETVDSLLSIQYNEKLNYKEYYDKIKLDKPFLGQVASSVKYKS